MHNTLRPLPSCPTHALSGVKRRLASYLATQHPIAINLSTSLKAIANTCWHAIMTSSRDERRGVASLPDPTKAANLVRLVVISDTHGYHELLNEELSMHGAGTILVHCGDYSNRGSIDVARKFLLWFSQLDNFSEKLLVDGNHDRDIKSRTMLDIETLIAEVETAASGKSGIRLLQDEHVTTKSGLTIYGASWRSCAHGDFTNLLNSRNATPHVLMAHLNPSLSPATTLPQVGWFAARGWLGSEAISHVALDSNIPLVLGGHIHWARGVVRVKPSCFNAERTKMTTFVNASTLLHSGDRGPAQIAKPVIVDFDVDRARVVHVECER